MSTIALTSPRPPRDELISSVEAVVASETDLPPRRSADDIPPAAMSVSIAGSRRSFAITIRLTITRWSGCDARRERAVARFAVTDHAQPRIP